MTLFKQSLLSLALVAVPAASVRPQSLELVAARFYRPSSGQTVVDAFCQVPFALLDF